MVLAKWTDRDVRVLLVDEPTRGIDVGAKAEVFGLLDDLASKGTGVVMVSSEFEELVENCDRVVAIGSWPDPRRVRGSESHAILDHGDSLRGELT